MPYVKINNRPFEKSVNHLVDEFFGGFPGLFKETPGLELKNGQVPVNIKETTNNYLVELIAPGFNKTDFKINLDANILTVSITKKEEEKKDAEKAQPEEKQILREYSYRSFNRSFTIDDHIDATGIEASYVNGVMTLNLPKKKEVREEVKEIIVK